MSGPPRLDGLCFVNTIIVRYQVDPLVLLRRIPALQRVEQIPKERVRFALPETVVKLQY